MDNGNGPPALIEISKNQDRKLLSQLEWPYLFLIARSLVQVCGRAVIIIIHYCGFSGSSANPEQSKPRKVEKFAYGYRFQVTLKDLPRHQHLTNTLTNSVAIRYTF